MTHMAGRGSRSWAIIHCLPGTSAGSWARSGAVRTGTLTPMGDASITGGGLTHCGAAAPARADSEYRELCSAWLSNTVFSTSTWLTQDTFLELITGLRLLVWSPPFWCTHTCGHLFNYPLWKVYSGSELGKIPTPDWFAQTTYYASRPCWGR